MRVDGFSGIFSLQFLHNLILLIGSLCRSMSAHSTRRSHPIDTCPPSQCHQQFVKLDCRLRNGCKRIRNTVTAPETGQRGRGGGRGGGRNVDDQTDLIHNICYKGLYQRSSSGVHFAMPYAASAAFTDHFLHLSQIIQPSPASEVTSPSTHLTPVTDRQQLRH